MADIEPINPAPAPSPEEQQNAEQIAQEKNPDTHEMGDDEEDQGGTDTLQMQP